MKAIFFCFLLLFLSITIATCTAHKKSATSVTASQIAVATSETQTDETTHSAGTTETEKLTTEDADIHIIRYDTTLPPDSATGKPPVREDIFITSTKKSAEKSQSAQANKTQTNQTTTQAAAKKNDTDQKTENTAAVAGGNSFIWIWITAGVIIAGVILYRVFTGKNRKFFDKTFDNTFE